MQNIKKIVAPLAFLGMFTLAACGGAKAVEELEALSTKVCECDGDEACLEDASKMADDFVSKHANARGGDQEKIESAMMEMTKCDPGFTLEFASKLE